MPVLDKLTRFPNNGIDTVILVPARELTEYVDQQVEGFAYFTDFNSMPVCSTPDGSSYEQEKRALRKGAEIVIATPDRLYLHLKMGNANLNNLRHLILNDADRLLDMGLYPDMVHLSRWLPENVNTMIFSASLPKKANNIN